MPKNLKKQQLLILLDITQVVTSNMGLYLCIFQLGGKKKSKYASMYMNLRLKIST